MTSSQAPRRPDAPERDVASARDLPGRPATAVSRREDGQHVAVSPGARRGHNFAASAHDLLAEHQPLGQPLRSAILRDRPKPTLERHDLANGVELVEFHDSRVRL